MQNGPAPWEDSSAVSHQTKRARSTQSGCRAACSLTRGAENRVRTKPCTRMFIAGLPRTEQWFRTKMRFLRCRKVAIITSKIRKHNNRLNWETLYKFRVGPGDGGREARLWHLPRQNSLVRLSTLTAQGGRNAPLCERKAKSGDNHMGILKCKLCKKWIFDQAL